MLKFSKAQKFILLFLFTVIFLTTYLYINNKRKREIVNSSIRWIESYNGSFSLKPMPGWYNSSPKFLKNMLSHFVSTELESINLATKSISLISSFEEFPNLKILNLEETQINDLKFIRNNTELEVLKLSSTAVDDLSPLKKLTKLKHLDLSYTNVNTLKAIPELKNLEFIGLRGLKLKDSHFILNFSKLQKLEIDKDFDPQAIEEIRKNRPACKVIISP